MPSSGAPLLEVTTPFRELSTKGNFGACENSMVPLSIPTLKTTKEISLCVMIILLATNGRNSVLFGEEHRRTVQEALFGLWSTASTITQGRHS
jgi:hypothetical protein